MALSATFSSPCHTQHFQGGPACLLDPVVHLLTTSDQFLVIQTQGDSDNMYYVMFMLAFVLAILPAALAHGYVSSVSIDGKLYKGNVPNQTPSAFLSLAFPYTYRAEADHRHFLDNSGDSPIRLIDDIDPVKGASNPNLSCGQGAALAAIVAPANPGSSVAFSWVSGGGGNVRSLSSMKGKEVC